jgi:hypothetical protein
MAMADKQQNNRMKRTGPWWESEEELVNRAQALDESVDEAEEIERQDRLLERLWRRRGDRRRAEQHREHANQLLEQIEEDQAEEIRLLEMIERVDSGEAEELATYITSADLTTIRTALASLMATIQEDVAITAHLRKEIVQMYEEMEARLAKPVPDRKSALTLAARLVEFLTAVFSLAQQVRGVSLVWQEYDGVLRPFVKPHVREM